MPVDEKDYGTDLRLLGDLARQEGRRRGSDLFVVQDVADVRAGDLDTLTGVNNLKQALLLRFLTPYGELAALGHPDYGSNLYVLIGEPNNDTNRDRAKVYVLQALASEPRVKAVLGLTVTPDQAFRDQINIQVSLRVIYSNTPLNLVFPFSLTGGGVTT
jgi:phage baseplate assembly protein W